jgi:hypothetical protein
MDAELRKVVTLPPAKLSTRTVGAGKICLTTQLSQVSYRSDKR